jgi:hypothetical protein
MSLFSVAFSDVYVRMLAKHVWHDVWITFPDMQVHVSAALHAAGGLF